jgi:hypothetical protein
MLACSKWTTYHISASHELSGWGGIKCLSKKKWGLCIEAPLNRTSAEQIWSFNKVEILQLSWEKKDNQVMSIFTSLLR